VFLIELDDLAGTRYVDLQLSAAPTDAGGTIALLGVSDSPSTIEVGIISESKRTAVSGSVTTNAAGAPEPGSAALLGSAGLVAWLLRRRLAVRG
jgi:hypothetical protein